MNSTLAFSKNVGKSLASFIQGRTTIMIPDAPSLEPRYGHGKPPHAPLAAILDRSREQYRALLTKFLDLQEHYLKIPTLRTTQIPADEPCWVNRWLPGLDSAALYGIIACHRPARYIEIGSGNSTMFARRAILDHNLATTITSIDPQPRAEIDSLCDRVCRMPAQDIDLGLFEELTSGDVLFVDSSHRVFTNSDVTVVFMDILPRLQSGVLIHFHDIWLPEDYQPAWSDRYYAEQYMLAMLLMFGDQFEIVLPNHFITQDADLASVLAPMWDHPKLNGVRRDGASFWIRKK